MGRPDRCPAPGPDFAGRRTQCDRAFMHGHHAPRSDAMAHRHEVGVAPGVTLVWDGVHPCRLEGPVADCIGSLGEALLALGTEWEMRAL